LIWFFMTVGITGSDRATFIDSMDSSFESDRIYL